jgi:hypothetical protein
MAIIPDPIPRPELREALRARFAAAEPTGSTFRLVEREIRRGRTRATRWDYVGWLAQEWGPDLATVTERGARDRSSTEFVRLYGARFGEARAAKLLDRRDGDPTTARLLDSLQTHLEADAGAGARACVVACPGGW